MKIRIKMLKTVQSDIFLWHRGKFRVGTILCSGMEYDAVANPLGEISGICNNGERLGVKPDEFEFLRAPADLLVTHGKIEKDSAVYNAIKISDEIEAKGLTRVDFLKEVISNHCCPDCWSEDELYLDLSSKRPVFRCMWCGYIVSLRSLAKRARQLPADYMERFVKGDADNMRKSQVGPVYIPSLSLCIIFLMAGKEIAQQQKC